MKLNLGCGDDILPDYDNIDMYDFRSDKVIQSNIVTLPDYLDDSVDEILATAVIEHLTIKDFDDAIRRWFQILKPGGFVQTECPDIMYVAKKILDDGLTDELCYEIWGQYYRPWDAHWNGSDILEGQFHKNGFTLERIREIAGIVGFTFVAQMSDDYKKYKNPYSLCVRWYK